MALVTANQFQLVPQAAQSFALGRQQGQQIRAFDEAQERARQQQRQADIGSQFARRALAGDKGAVAGLAVEDPRRAAALQSFISQQDQAQRAETAREQESLTRSALNALSLPPEQRRQFIAQERQRFIDEGRSTENVDRALAIQDDAQLEQALQFQVRQGQEIRDIFEQQFPDTSKAEDRDLRSRQLAIQEAAEERQARKLSAGLEKALLTAQDRTVEAQRNANEFDVLAKDFERRNQELEGGVRGTFSETLKAILGTQDDVTEFRRRFNKVRLSEGLRNLPPGPATDRDVKEAFKGVPRENASPEQVASFLRGAARLARFEAGFNQFKSDFISRNRSAAGLNRQWRRQEQSPVLNRKVSVAEIYETAQNRGVTPEEVIQRLGLSDAGLI